MATTRKVGEICLSIGAANRVVVFDFTEWLNGANLASGTVSEVDTSDLTIGTPSVETSSTTVPYTGQTIAANKALNVPITIASTVSEGVRKILVTPTDNSSSAQSEPMIFEINCV